MADLNQIHKLPDISFIDDLTLEDLNNKALADFKQKYEEVTGTEIELAPGDPNRIILLSCMQYIYQAFQNVEKAGRMNFLKYSYGDYLENLASLKRITRNQATAATCIVKFKLSAIRSTVTAIPKGTRVTAGDGIFYATEEYAEIPSGEIELEVSCVCTQTGFAGNSYQVGELDVLVDTIAFIESVENTTAPSGGSDAESDEELAYRTFLAPSSWSVAGPDDAYEFWVKDANPSIGDVKVTSPTPGVVDIRFIMLDGTMPDTNMIKVVDEHLNQRSKRPLTDNVQVMAPEEKEFNIDVKYYINSSDVNSASLIQNAVEKAIEDYKTWQEAKIGRDIIPDELVRKTIVAGAKRIEITAPTFEKLSDISKAVCGNVNITYGGLEDD